MRLFLPFVSVPLTFFLNPFSHYNSITELCAWFFLSLLDHLTIDFPSYFILSIIDVYRDTVTCDKLIFPSAITRILRHFSVPFPISNHFHVMCAIGPTTFKWSEAQPHSRWSGSATPLTPSTLSTFTPSSSVRGDSWCDHGTASVHGWSPWYTLYWVVSSDHPW